MQQIVGEGYTLYVCPIQVEDAATPRRRQELAATARLVEAAFGPQARKCNDALGAPFIVVDDKPVAIPVSLSHSRHYAVLAVSRSQALIGVDVEEQRAPLARVVQRICSPAEWQAYSATPESLLVAWTTKEALFKACRAFTGGQVDFATMLRLPLAGAPATAYTVGGAQIASYDTYRHSSATEVLISVVLTRPC